MKLPSTQSSPLDLASTDDAAGCLSGALRLLFCASLRRDNGVDGGEPEGHAAAKDESAGEQKKPPATPSIIARLMGLDSMPVHPYAPPRDSVNRSRSTNSLDTWPVFLAHKRTSSDTQIRPSSSFREAPTYLRKENEEYLLLSFAGDDENRAFTTKHKIAVAELKEEKPGVASRANGRNPRRKERTVMDENRDSVNSTNSTPPKKYHRSKPRPHHSVNRDMPMRPRRRKSASTHRKLESECSSQNSSPVSVLDRPIDECGCSLSPEYPISEYRKHRSRRPRRRLSSELAERDNNRLSSIDSGKRSVGERKIESRKPEQAYHGFSEMWEVVCRIAEEEAKTTHWVLRGISGFDGVGEVAAEIGVEILDLLLGEAVAEFSRRFVAR